MESTISWNFSLTFSHSWADLWIMSGTAMRELVFISTYVTWADSLGLSIPLGLCGARGYDEILWGPNFGDTYPNFKENILPPTSDFVELEIRKRTFWMAFRMCGSCCIPWRT